MVFMLWDKMFMSLFTRSHVGYLALGTCLAGATYLVTTQPVAKGQDRPAVWAAPAMTRVGRHDGVGGGSSINISAARGEYESFQVVVSAANSKLTSVRIDASDLAGPNGAIIPAGNLAIYREEYITVKTSSQDMGGSNRPLPPGEFPDALIPAVDPQTGAPLNGRVKAFPVDVAINSNQPFWVDVFVPRDSPAGIYKGTVTASGDQGSLAISLVLNVWNFTLPVKPSLHSSFGIYSPLTSNAQVQQELIRHRLMPFVVNQPGDGNEAIERQAVSDVGVPLYTQANQKTCRIAAPPSLDSMSRQVASAVQVAPGALVYVYLADEVSRCVSLFPALKQWAQTIHAAGAATLLTAIPLPDLQDDGSGTHRSVADIWALLPKDANANASNVATVMTKGDQVWSYTALVQDNYSPKWLLDFLPINFRAFGTISESLGLTGVLYWSVNYWTQDPWTSVDYSESGHNFPGEGSLLYPGSSVGIDGAVPSMRMKWLRDGMDDYEYVEILKSMGRGDWALQLVRGVASDWRHWSHDWQDTDNLRQQLGDEISRLSTSSNPQ
jgi:hypothetical protein